MYEGTLEDSHCTTDRTFVCSEPTRQSILVDSQLVFTSENISAPALQFNWTTNLKENANKPKESESALQRFQIEWRVEGQERPND